MKIAFVVSYLESTGGHRAVLEIGTRLVRRGHDVTLVYPERSILSRRNEVLRRLGPDALLGPLYRRNGDALDWFDFPGRILRVPDLDPRYAPEADVVVATAWQTAERVARFPSSAGRQVYFIQHYETWSGSSARVDATWQRPFIRIASSAWLAELAREKFGIGDVNVIPYGVDHATFWPEPVERADGRVRVGFLYHVEPWKGVAESLAAIEAARVDTSIEIIAFGVFSGADLPDDVEYHLRPTRDELRRLYSSLDVFLCGSWTETGPMTVPEAMACGTCVVSTAVGNVPLWTRNGEGALLARPRDAADLAAQTRRAVSDPVERRRRADRGRELIAPFTWDRAAEAFDDVLRAAT
jgi:glycosyltransferase involved in cell wall biosynthesis